jgi:predicted phage tail protein
MRAAVRVERVPDPRAVKVAAGGGGGGKGGASQQPHQPNIAPNTLRSLATVRILEALSEGPIFGGHNAPISLWQAILLDGTPIMDAAGNVQFAVKEGYFREGWPSQDPIPGYPLSESATVVNVQAHTGTAIVRSLNTPLSAVRFVLRLPGLFSQKDNGDVTEASVTYTFDVAVNGGAWFNIVTERISGKTMSPYERAVRVPLPYDATDVQVRVTRVDAEPAQGVNNIFFWSTYTEIVDGQIAYDDTAVAAMTIDAETFPNIPQRAYLLDGLLVDVPSNYDSRARTYAGDWDGTFQTAWTNNPAWVLYALLTNERWGLGRFLDVSAVDKWSFYEAARYNDEPVPDGLGGTEPRWTCNCVINTRQDAFAVLNAVASSMLALLFWANGTVFIVQDSRSGPPSRLFSPADVEGGLFNYQGSDFRSRWTAAAITWNDPSDKYQAAVELVQDNELVAQQGYRETQQTAFACTSRGQAIRFGRWLIYTNQFETEVVTFRVGLENADLRPGEPISISDPSRVGARLGGRLLDDSDPGTLALDLVPEAMKANPAAWTLYVTVGSAAEAEKPSVCAVAVQSVVDEHRVAVVGKRLDMVAGCNWMGSSAAVEPTQWRVAGASEREDGTYEILATEHHEEKFDYVDDGVLIPPPPFSLVPTSNTLTPPSDLAHREYIYLDGSGQPQFGVVMSWQASPDPRVTRYMLELSGPAGDYRRFAQVATVAQDVPNMRQGEWLAVLRGFDNIGRRTVALTYNFTPVGLSEKPAAPSALYLTPQDRITTLAWVPPPDLDVVLYWIKWSPLMDGSATWAAGTTSIARVTRNTTQTTTPTRSGTFMIKSVDSLGQESDSFAAAILNDQQREQHYVVDEAEQPAWAGDLSDNWHKVGAQLWMPPPEEPEPIAPGVFPGDRSLAINQAPTRLDVYGFAATLDKGVVSTHSMIAVILGNGALIGTTMSAWRPLASADPLGVGVPGAMVGWVPLATAKPLATNISDQWDAHIEMRVSQDGVAFDEWTPLKSTLITARAVEWRLVGAVYDLRTTLKLSRAEVLVEVPSRTLGADDAALDGTGHLVVTYPVGFAATPTVQLTARQGLAPGGNIVLVESDRNHFKVEHRNAAGAAVGGGSIDYFVQGYGGHA